MANQKDERTCTLQPSNIHDDTIEKHYGFDNVQLAIEHLMDGPVDPGKLRTSLKYLRRLGFPAEGRGKGRALAYSYDDLVLITAVYEVMAINSSPEYSASLIRAHAADILQEVARDEPRIMIYKPSAVKHSLTGANDSISFIERGNISRALPRGRFCIVYLSSIRDAVGAAVA